MTDPELLATFVLNAWEGAVLRARIEKCERPLRQFIDVSCSTQLLHYRVLDCAGCLSIGNVR